MAAPAPIIQVQQPVDCGICLQTFSQDEKKYSHQGGEQHGFHESCIRKWLQTNSPNSPNCCCPYDRRPLDPNTLPPTTMERVAKFFENEVLLGVPVIVSTAIGTAMAAMVATDRVMAAMGRPTIATMVTALLADKMYEAMTGTSVKEGALGGMEMRALAIAGIAGGIMGTIIGVKIKAALIHV